VYVTKSWCLRDEGAGSVSPRDHKPDAGSVDESVLIVDDMREISEFDQFDDDEDCSIRGELGAEEQGDKVDGVPMPSLSSSKASFGTMNVAPFFVPSTIFASVTQSTSSAVPVR